MFCAHRVRHLETLCSIGVAGSDRDSGGEHQGRSSRDVTGAGNFLSGGIFPSVSIDMLYRLPFSGGRMKAGYSELCWYLYNHSFNHNPYS
jgi:hypothetical protein